MKHDVPNKASSPFRPPVDDRDAVAVTILYTNYRDETALRTVIPEALWFGETDWHRGMQWFMDAYDVERHAIRSFALVDIHRWSPTASRDEDRPAAA